jgi:hypothetical protein
VSEEHDLVFTSNRGENTVGIFSPDRELAVAKVKVGVGPNGLAYDAEHGLLLAANVGDPARPGSCTVSLVDVGARALVADVRVPGRTRWAIFDDASARFYVNIADPAPPLRRDRGSWTDRGIRHRDHAAPRELSDRIRRAHDRLRRRPQHRRRLPAGDAPCRDMPGFSRLRRVPILSPAVSAASLARFG